jgi:hypothetical protein
LKDLGDLDVVDEDDRQASGGLDLDRSLRRLA